MKKKYLTSTLLLVTLSICIFIFYRINYRPIINIGVPLLHDPFYRYDLLKDDIESNFNVKINFINLYDGLDFNNLVTEQDVMNNVDNILRENKVDMIIGLPSHQLEYAIKNERLLDITNYIENIENIHKGVVNRSIKMGDGKLFYISPIISLVHLVFQNELIFEELGIDMLPEYVSWYEFLDKLEQIEQVIEYNELTYFPLALGVTNDIEDLLFTSHDFIMHGFGLDSPMFNNNKFTPKWKSFFSIWSQIIANYGKTLTDMDFGRVPGNNIFNNSKYAMMLGNTFSLELFFNKSFNSRYNENVQLIKIPEFPIKISFVNYDASRTQNFRDTSIAINKNTNNKELATKILNFLTSEEYAFKIIESMPYYSHFSNAIFSYPSYYSDSTIYALNSIYDNEFDIRLIYSADYGSRIYNEDHFNDFNLFNKQLNEAFTNVFNNRLNNNLNYEIEQSIIYIENNLN